MKKRAEKIGVSEDQVCMSSTRRRNHWFVQKAATAPSSHGSEEDAPTQLTLKMFIEGNCENSSGETTLRAMRIAISF